MPQVDFPCKFLIVYAIHLINAIKAMVNKKLTFRVILGKN
jgi:hypothetical protein